MLIRNAEVWGNGFADLRIERGIVTALGALAPRSGETVFDARGGALLPGLHDHHIHLAGLAARRNSVDCGPPTVSNEQDLAAALAGAGTGWIRGTGFHECVLGGVLPDAALLDRFVSQQPLRLQHSTGRMWLLNSCALDELLARASAPPGLERKVGRFTGRLFDEDRWLQQALASQPPDLAHASRELVACGITGVTDMSPRNDAAMGAHFDAQSQSGALIQSLVLAGGAGLADCASSFWRLGPLKLHLHEAALPDFDQCLAFLRIGREQGRALAVHCVSEVELVFAIALLEAAGSAPGDRIEHVSVATPELVIRMAALSNWACVQPHFIAERGDRYLAEVEPRHHNDLYRLRSLDQAGIAMAGGSDAPYGSADPWAAMAAAVSRTTSAGVSFTANEALTPEQALALYLADPTDFTRQRQIGAGTVADFCLLDRPWEAARKRLVRSDVAAVWKSGRLVHQRVDQSPVQRLPGADAAP